MAEPRRLSDPIRRKLQELRTRLHLTPLPWWLAFTLLLLVGYGLRMWNLGQAELSYDEVATVYVARRPFLDIVRYVMQAAREHPPLYYMGVNIWFRLAGTSEFALRYPSTLINLLSIAWGIHLGRKILGNEGAWWNGLLLALTPLSLWAARNGRMYALVLLLGMLTVEAWLRWNQKPTWKNWLLFMALTLVGLMTHYFLILLWAVEAVLLVLAPKFTKHTRWVWLATTAAATGVLAGFAVLSPGVRAMIGTTLGLFPLREIRLEQLEYVMTELYMAWPHPTLLPIALAGLALSATGWFLVWRRERVDGLLLAVWGLAPIAVMNFVPVALQARYLIMVYPALALGLAAVITLLRPHLARIALAGLILVQAVMHLDRIYLPPENTFSQQVTLLHAAAQPGDALLFNGPWPNLLLTYYAPPEGLDKYLIPQTAPPGFNAEVDVPRLEAIVENHERIWTFYGAIQPTDPHYSVSRWLAEHTYAVHEYKEMVLYMPPDPERAFMTLAGDIDLGDHLVLGNAKVDGQEAKTGDFIRLNLEWERKDVPGKVTVSLALLDADGHIWQRSKFSSGPVHRVSDTDLPNDWVDRRGLWILPGIPPGAYTLGVHVEGEGVEMPGDTIHGQWLSLGEIVIGHRAMAEAMPYRFYLPNVQKSESGEVATYEAALPRYADVEAKFGDILRLVGVEPGDFEATQGYPFSFRLWWKTTEQWDSRSRAPQLRVRLAGRGQNTEDGPFELGPDFYPVEGWKAGEVVQQEITLILPEELPGGTYHVQVQIVDEGGSVHAVEGSRDAVTAGERWQGRVTLAGAWADLFTITVEERERNYRVPLNRTRTNIRFGDVLRLRGYKLEQKRLAPGEATEFTVYWQALKRPERTYAVFNHLRAPGNMMLWQQDSWPRGGEYTTSHWLAGEVVEERYTITIPDDATPGVYPLYMGVYNPHNGDRLVAVNAQGEQYVNDEVVLLEIEVE